MTELRAPVGSTTPIRVLVVDDSVVQRGVLMALLVSDPAFEIVGWAANGLEAVRAAAMLKPDIITMDLRMPRMDGVEAARQIMQETPTPIVMVTASMAREAPPMIAASLQAGVLAIVAKPLPGSCNSYQVDEFLRTVKNMAQVKVIRRWAPERLRHAVAHPPSPLPARSTRPLELVAIGASTGGPQALQGILPVLPATFALPLLVVQHIAPGFESGLIDWLRPQCALPIQLVERNTTLHTPGIYVAPQGKHLSVRGHLATLSADAPVRGHRPSATRLFESVAAHYGQAAIGVLLTGMGDDGARGLRDIKQAGGITIAQDEDSSAVFGMPAAAITLGVVDYVLPPAQIASLLLQLVGLTREGE